MRSITNYCCSVTTGDTEYFLEYSCLAMTPLKQSLLTIKLGNNPLEMDVPSQSRVERLSTGPIMLQIGVWSEWHQQTVERIKYSENLHSPSHQSFTELSDTTRSSSSEWLESELEERTLPVEDLFPEVVANMASVGWKLQEKVLVTVNRLTY